MNKQEAIDRLVKHLEWGWSEEITEAIVAGIYALKENQWIPCSERMPSKPLMAPKGYIVQKGNVMEPFSAYWDGEKWIDLEDDIVDDVVAWMPLPETYKGD